MDERLNSNNKSKYQDIAIRCVDCDKDFEFTSAEQQFFYSKGLSTPKRCKPCRKARKESIVREERY